MPLMADWSESLCEALDARESGLAQACGLVRGASGPDFEKNLGLLLDFQRLHPLAAHFIDLGGPHPGSHTSDAETARDAITRRLEMVMEVLNTTLYDLFGLDRVDDDRAAKAYASLIRELAAPELVVATTNYDRSVETALEQIGGAVDSGASATAARTPVLQYNGPVREPRGQHRSCCICMGLSVGTTGMAGFVITMATSRFGRTSGAPSFSIRTPTRTQPEMCS